MFVVIFYLILHILKQITMNKIKQLLFLLLVVTTTLQSCSNSDDSVRAEKSSALRVFLREMKAANNISSRT